MSERILGGKITVLYGENSFEKSQALTEMRAAAAASGFEIEKIDADKMTAGDFSVAISGVSLFAEKRFVAARNLSENKEIWSALEKLLPQISSDVHLCLVEEKIDKRSSFYKNFAKIADFREFKNLTTKDSRNLAEFARKLAKNFEISLDHKTADFLISWVGVDEWRIKTAVERLGILGDFSIAAIQKYIPQNSESNAFEVLNLAFSGNFERLIVEISKLKIREGTDGAYLFFGLISSQFFNLAALKIGKSEGRTTAEIAKEIGANAWALGKMESVERGISREELARLSKMFTDTDKQMKSSGADAWDLTEGLLLEICGR